MTPSEKLDQHMRETADMARAAMAGMLQAVSKANEGCTPGNALATVSGLQAAAQRMDASLAATRESLNAGDADDAELDAARLMSVSDYAGRLAKLRAIAADMSAYDEAQSGSAS